MLGLDQSTLEELFRQARASSRLRSHRLLHSGHDDPVQRLVIALCRGTYLRPHMHSAQWEMLTLLHGAADVLFFTPDGRCTERFTLATGRTTILQIPVGQVHSLVVLEDDTALLELKPGPYRPNEFMDWAPAEGAAAAAPFVAWMETASAGSPAVQRG